MAIIKPIIEKFPERKFILIGDSGEKDPEVYSIIAKKFRSNIKAILIREVGDSNKNKSRYTQLFGELVGIYIKVFKNTDSINRAFLID